MINQKIQNTNLKFDLFKLHVPEEDKDPRWSWIRASGKDLSPFVYSLIRELTHKNGTNNTAKKIKKLIPRLSIQTILDYFWSKNQRFPLVFLEALYEQFKNGEEVKKQMLNKIEILSISRYDSKPIKAVKELNLILCKIAGAHAADGSLWGEYNYQLIDSNESAVIEFTRWLEEVFGYKIKAKKHKKSKAHNVYFKSRIIGRYLNKFLDFPIGKKTDTVKEPEIIKNSNLDFRKAFALGVMTFDGSVDIRGKPMIQSKSRNLILDLHEIFKNETILISFNNKPDKMGRYTLQFRNFEHKLLNYFDKESEKHERLCELVYGFQGKVKNLEEAKKAFDLAYPKTTLSLITFSKILDILKQKQTFSYQTTLNTLKNQNTHISDTTLKYYIKILSNNGIVHLIEKKPFKVFKFNNNLKEWKVPKR